MSPQSVNSSVPGVSLVPSFRNESAPCRTMLGTWAKVSTLFTSAGLGESGVARSPRSYGGYCGSRGSGPWPSSTLRSAFSSPKRYSSGPATILRV